MQSFVVKGEHAFSPVVQLAVRQILALEIEVRILAGEQHSLHFGVGSGNVDYVPPRKDFFVVQGWKYSASGRKDRGSNPCGEAAWFVASQQTAVSE